MEQLMEIRRARRGWLAEDLDIGISDLPPDADRAALVAVATAYGRYFCSLADAAFLEELGIVRRASLPPLPSAASVHVA